ncbi:SDR family oxidoreductase [Furfurilactobacillus rossiae]|uniref:Saccharopine dehydrogenase related protein n=1 Tax=Furfurilactobacillus rossiae DSM 15814 TaxID=1114972 RepID=A0A0R1R9C9_9LACO|nr:SDR family oxidoreductase [Furfurilactobacillus rossiae]KRL53324.1 saccharopine dehydrogenase related protein [Furfurilactobacillus rossiae DSM 15814]QFR67482.1 NAD(P)H-binding protein [Furfurilactobacillus rossiae]QLE60431.1 oxidoreductase putative [Furfurilactobacillus rossiae]
MQHVLILGAGGKIAKLTETMLLAETDAMMTLFLRHPEKIAVSDEQRETVVTGDAANADDLAQAMKGQDVVYANLAGSNIETQAQQVVKAMNEAGVNRLVWISTLGIYDEVPGAFGKWNHQMLDDGYLPSYAAAAKVVEDSDLDYTIIRPAWLQNQDEIDYELTNKGDAFKGTEVSRKSIAAVVTSLITDPTKHIRASLGVNKPNTDGAKPSWY